MSPLQAGGLSLGALAVGFAYTRTRREADRLRRQLASARRAATHDQLTGVRNRAGLAEAWMQVGHRGPALILLDLDGFKPVNDIYGHAAGDVVLAVVARRIARHDVVARLGGDEFVVVVPGRDGPLVASRIAKAVAEPIRVNDTEQVTVTASVGWTTAHGGDLSTALAQADAAMYRAKVAASAGVVGYHPHADDRPSVAANPRPAVRVRDLTRDLPAERLAVTA